SNSPSKHSKSNCERSCGDCQTLGEVTLSLKAHAAPSFSRLHQQFGRIRSVLEVYHLFPVDFDGIGLQATYGFAHRRGETGLREKFIDAHMAVGQDALRHRN